VNRWDAAGILLLMVAWATAFALLQVSGSDGVDPVPLPTMEVDE